MADGLSVRAGGRAAIGLLVLASLAACGGPAKPAARAPTPAGTSSPAPSPSVSVDPSSLSAVVYGGRSTTGAPVGYDDHVNFLVVNTGRDISDLFIDLSGGDRWLDHHSIAMGTTPRCNTTMASLNSGRTWCTR